MPPKKKEPAKSKQAAETSAPAAGGGTPEEFEQAGIFHVRRCYEPVARQAKHGWLLYDTKDLVTRAVCVGG